MTQKLKEKRDEACAKYENGCFDSWHNPGFYLEADFNKGFEDACNLLLPEIKKLEEALSVYKSDMDIEICEACENCVSEVYVVETTPPNLEPETFGTVAKKALQSLREFLGSEAENE